MTLHMWLSICAWPYLFWFLVKQEEEEDEQNLPIIAPYIHDARYHAHPYILSTTVLSHLASG